MSTNLALLMVTLLTNDGPTHVWGDGRVTVRSTVRAQTVVKHQCADGVLLDFTNLTTVGTWTHTYRPALGLPVALPPLPPPDRRFARLPARTMRGLPSPAPAPSPLPKPLATLTADQVDGLVIWGSLLLDTNCGCQMVGVTFQTRTNHIYGLECSHDLVRWFPRPPEIDGEDDLVTLQDVIEAGNFYRVSVREGVLPPEDP